MPRTPIFGMRCAELFGPRKASVQGIGTRENAVFRSDSMSGRQLAALGINFLAEDRQTNCVAEFVAIKDEWERSRKSRMKAKCSG